MRENSPHESERLNAYFDLIRATDGKATNQELEKAVRKAETIFVQKIGDRSEKKFMEFAKRIGDIKSVFKPSCEDDVFNGIDMWLKFNDTLGLPNLPVQVKSSDRDVNMFKTKRHYIKHAGMEIVINCGPTVSLKMFRNQLTKEVSRIKNALISNPELYKNLPKR